MNLNNFNKINFDSYTAYLKASGLSDASIKRKLSSLTNFQKYLVKKNLIQTPSIQNPPVSTEVETPSLEKGGLINKIFKNRKFPLLQGGMSRRDKGVLTYLLLVSLLIISSAVGYGFYRQSIKNAKSGFAYSTSSSPVYADRFLSFQGRLTDSSGNPITSSVSIRFDLFNTETVGTGTSLYTSATGNSQTVVPDENGIFSVTIGKTHGTEIPDSVFTQNPAVYLQITAGGETMSPRQPIATVAYAINAETLQGMPPSASGLKDTVLTVDSSGNLNLGETSPTIKSTSGTLGIEGQAVLIKASDGSGGNIEINPDANGIIKLTTEGSGSTAVNGFIDATNANLSTGNLYSATIRNTNRGYNFLNFQNYNPATTTLATRFSVDAYGNTLIGGTMAATNISIGNTLLTTSAYRLNLFDSINPTAGSLIYGNGSKLVNTSVGTSGQVLVSNGNSAPTWVNSTSIGNTYTAGNGLSLSGNEFRFGGSLSQSTNLDLSNYSLNFLSNGTTLANFTASQNTFYNPTSFVSSGDVSMAYDLNFTNSTSSTIRSNSPLYIQTESPYANLDINLTAANSGKIYLNSDSEITKNLTVGGTFVSVGSTNLVTNLNADLLDGLHSSNFLQVGNSGAFVYTASAGITQVGNDFRLNLGYSPTWTALHTFTNGIGVSGTTNLTNALNVGGTAYFASSVGIGTTAPTKSLEVNGDTLLSGYGRTLQISNSGSAFLNFSNSGNSISYGSNQFAFNTSQIQGFTFTGGNVGIGTTAPGYKLDVVGSGRFSSDVRVGTEMLIQNSTISMYNGSSSIYAPSGVRFTYWNGSNVIDSLKINNVGNVGIGTTNPLSRLDINYQSSFNPNIPGTNAYGGLHFSGQTTSDYVNGISWNGGTSGTQAGLYVQGSGAYGTKMYFATTNSYATGAQTRMMINQNGSVGIGTTNPTNKLTVIGNGSFSTSLSVGTTLTTGTLNATNAQTTNLVTNLNADLLDGHHSSDFLTSGDVTGYVPYTGATGDVNLGSYNLYATKVGIGTTSPSQALDVNGKIAINGVQTIYNASATNSLNDSLFIGDGGQNSSHTSGTQGYYNTGVGIKSLYSNTTGYQNTALGRASLYSNTTGYNNTAIGFNSLFSNVTGHDGVAIGSESQRYIYGTGSTAWTNYNTSIGYQALRGSTTATDNTGNNNTAIGYQSLISNTTGSYNSTNGVQALYANTTGSNNSAQGYMSLYTNTTGSNNTAQGMYSLVNLTGAYSNNTALGYNAGRYYNGTTGGINSASNSLFLGASASALADGDTNETVIGYNAIGNGSNSATLGNDSITKTILKGNVGIGTTAPIHKLEVNGTGMFGIINVSEVRLGATANAVGHKGIGLYHDGTEGFLQSVEGGVNWNDITLQAKNIRFDTGGNADRMLINSSGNVGIGTTSPSHKLEVLGDAYFSTNLSIGGTFLSVGSTNLVSNLNADLLDGHHASDFLSVGSTDTLVGGTDVSILSSGNSRTINNTSTLSSVTGRGASTSTMLNLLGGAYFGSTNQSILKNDGSIGIGLTNPSQALDVNGKIAINGQQTIYNADALGTFTGSLFVGNGGGSLSHTTGSEGYYNTGVGTNSLYSNTTGYFNTAFGRASLYSNTTGYNNSVQGAYSLQFNTTGSYNSTVGNYSLNSSITGSNGVAVGFESQRYANDTATAWTNYNTSVGYQALRGSTTAANNTGNYNTAIGYQSLLNNTTGSDNLAQGAYALYYNNTGSNNTALGYNALTNLTGSYNNNIAIGYNAGRYYNGTTGNLTSSSNSFFLGNSASALADSGTNEIVIGYNAIGNGSNSATLGNDSITKTILKGNVGIGTTAPLSGLDVNNLGSGVPTPLSSVPSYGLILGNSNTSAIMQLGINGGNATWIQGRMRVAGGSLPISLNPLGGNVGIGTTNPIQKLSVAGDGSFSTNLSVGGTLTLPQGASNGYILQSDASGNASWVNVTGVGSGVYVPYTGATGDVNLNNKALFNVSKVAIGLGATSSYSLDVNGKIAINGVQTIYNAGAYGGFTGSLFIGNGGNSLSHSAGDEGYYNTGIGSGALQNNTTGNRNTAQGAYALISNTTGSNNLSQGVNSLFNNTAGSSNLAQGYYSLYSNIAGSNGVAIGAESQRYLVGVGTLGSGDTTAWTNYNTSIGYQALRGNSAVGSTNTGNSNTAIGYQSLLGNTTGYSNVGIGYWTLYDNTTGYRNTALGSMALQHNSTGYDNFGLGYQSLYNDVSGNNNIAIGYRSGFYYNGTTGNLTSANQSLFLGGSSSALADGDTNEIVIGYNAIGNGSNSVTLGNDSVTKTILKGNVGINNYSPSHKLDVVGDASISTNLNVGGTLTLPQGASNGYVLSSDASGNASWTSATGLVSGTYVPYTGATGDVNLGSYNLYATKVGIGTTSPSQALDVNGKIAINGQQTIYNADALGTFTGSLFVGNGGGSLSHTTGNEGYYNIGIGSGATQYTTTGSFNTGLGVSALRWNTTGSNNLSLGYLSLYSNKTGSNGVAIGNESQRYANDTTSAWTNYNTSIGYQALRGSTTAANNTGNYNTAVGYGSMVNNTSGSYNTAIGWNTLSSNSTGSSNIAVGHGALSAVSTGSNNTGFGTSALRGITTTSNNSGFGNEAGRYFGGSTSNIVTTANNSLFLGANTYALADGDTNEIVIGYNAIGNGSNSVTLGNDSVTKTILKGNVGIGTTNPSESLTIHSTSIDGMSLGWGSISTKFIFSTNWNSGASDYLGIRNSNASIPQFVLSLAGYVGIGTTNPTSKLHVVGNGNITGNLTIGGTFVSVGSTNLVTNLNADLLDGLDSTQFLQIGNSGAFTYTSSAGITQVGNDFRLNLAYSPVWTGLHTFTNGIEVTGTTNLSGNLNVGGTAYFASRVGIGTTNPQAQLNSLSTSEQLRINYDNGKYGSFILDSNGGLNISNNTDGSTSWAGIFFKPKNGRTYFNASGLNNSFYAYDYTVDSSTYLTLTGSSFSLQRSGINKIYFNSNGNNFIDSGNLGIGTTAPTSKLHVVGNGNITGNLTIGGTFVSVGSTNLVSNLNADLLDGYHASDFVSIGSTGSYVYSAGNGLSLASNTFKLGGALTENTNLTIGNTSALFINATSGNVGIGTSSPSQKLDVNGNIKGQQLVLDNITGGSYNEGLRINGNPGTWRGIFLGGGTGTDSGTNANLWSILRDNNNNFRITTNSSNNAVLFSDISGNVGLGGISSVTNPVLSIKSTGNVGIGTTSPSAKLDIIGDGSFSTSLSVGTTLTVNTLNATRAQSTTVVTNLNADLLDGLHSSSFVQVGSTGAYIYTASTGITQVGNDFQLNLAYSPVWTGLHTFTNGVGVTGTANLSGNLNVGGASYFAGNVGIGTSNPTEKLEVAGKIKILDENIGTTSITFDGNTSAGLKLSNSDGYITLTPLNSGWAHLYTDRNNFIFNKPVYSIANTFSSYSTGDLWLQTGGTTRFTIQNSTGNVGIGTTNPSYKLDVSGTGRFTSNLNIGGTLTLSQGATNGYILTSDASGNSYWAPNTGIGTTYAAGNGLTLASNNFKLGGALTENTNLTIGNTSAFFINSTTGNVGIGTTNPDSKLETQGNIHISGVNNKLFFDTTGSEKSVSQYVDNDYSFNIYNERGSSSKLILDSGSVSLGTNSIKQFYLNTSSGNVGIGTTNPGYKLDVVGGDINLDSTRKLIWGGNTSRYISLDADASHNAVLSTFGNFSFDTYSGTTYNTKLFIKGSDGNVGIGTTNPLSTLNIVSAEIGTGADKGLRIDNHNFTKSYSLRTGISGAENTSFAIYDETAGANRLTISTDGNINILKNLTIGGTFVSVGSTNLVTNLNSDLLDGLHSSSFLQVGTSANFISSLTAGNGIDITGSGIGRTITNTGIINATNGTLTRSGSAGSYTLGLNLGNANTWTALQTFTNGIGVTGSAKFIPVSGAELIIQSSSLNTPRIQSYNSQPLFINELGNNLYLNTNGGNVGIGNTSPSYKLDVTGNGRFSTSLTVGSNLSVGGTFISVGSTNLVSNLNADLLDGQHSTYYLNIGQTGSLPYVNDTTNTTLTRSGSGPYTLGLNLANANTWTGPQTFGNLTIGGTFVSVGSTNLVTNLNADLLDGYHASTFLGVGSTGNFISTLTNGVGISISGSGVGRTINVDYDATKLTLTGNKLTLNLGSTNTWTGLQNLSAGATISNLSIGGTFLSVGSTNLVTNLNANYLGGLSSSAFLQIGNTGSLPYVNNATNGTLTRSGSGPYTLGLNLANANTWTANQTFSRAYQYADGVPTSNLGTPSITEMALFQEEFNNKTAFYNINNLKFYTYDGSSWTEYTTPSDTDKRKLLGGDSDSGIIIPNQTQKFRIELTNSGSYVFLNALYMYWSSNSHSSQVQIWKRDYATQAWTQVTSSTSSVSAWPGHLYLPFSSIPFASSSNNDAIRIEFTPTWSTGSYSTQNINLYRMQIWGGYPSGKRTIYTTDENQNVTFPKNINTGTTITANTVNFTQSQSTTKVTNLNADLLDGLDSSQFLQIGTSANFISSLTGGTDISIVGSGVGRTITNTSTLSSVTGRGASTSTMLNLLGGAYFGSTNQSILSSNGYVGIGTTAPSNGLLQISGEGASQGINLYNGTGNTFRIYRVNDIAIMGRQGVDSYGIAINSIGNVGIGTTSPSHKLDVVGNASISTNLNVGGTLTISQGASTGYILTSDASGNSYWSPNTGVGTTYAAGPGLTLASNIFSLNLGSTNTWTGPQTFGNLTIGGTFVSVGSTNLVTNLNADLLDGHHSSDFLQIGSTNSLLYVNNTTNTTLTRSGSGPYTLGLNLANANTWTGAQTFGNLTIGGTFVSVGSTNLVTNLNADLLDGHHASDFVGIGSTGNFIYTASTGITQVSNDFRLNLAYTPVWTGLHTFTNGIGVSGTANLTGNLNVGGTFVSVGSTNLVTNLNANYLNGLAYNNLPYVNNTTNTTLTRSGSGPYTLGLNLANANTWTAIQTFTNDIGVSGTANFTNNLNVGGTAYFASNVGIGTTNPTEKLTIKSGNIQLDNGYYYRGKTTAGTEYNILGINTNNLLAFNGPQGIIFATNSNYRMQLSSTGGLSLGSTFYSKDAGSGNLLVEGSIGIGTTAPTHSLEVIGDGYFSNSLSVGGTAYFASYIGIGTTSPIAPLEIGATTSTFIGGQTLSSLSANFTGSLTSPRYYDSDNSLYYVDPAVNDINYSSLNLAVQGSVKFNVNSGFVPNTYVNAYAASRIQGFTNGLSLDVGTTASIGIGNTIVWNNNLFLAANGNVGVGTTNPSAKLDINYSSGDGFYLNAESGANTIMRLKQSGAETAAIYTLDGKNDLHLRAAGDLWLDGGSGNTGAFILKNTGQVGIGTTNPSQQLHIENSGATEILVNGNTSGGSITYASAINLQSNTDYRGRGMFMTTADSSAEWFAGVPYTGGGYVIGYDSSGGQSEYKANSKLFINTSGFVGIGTTAPNFRLTVSDGMGLISSNGDNAGFYWNVNSYFRIDTYRSSDGRRLPIALQPDGGNVGIGTTSPSAALNVNVSLSAPNPPDPVLIKNTYNGSSAHSTLALESANSSSKQYISFYPTGVAGWSAGRESNGYFNISNSWKLETNPRLTINTSGNVGIGTTNPGYKLTVNGQPAANGYTAFTNYSDARLKTNISQLSDGYLDRIMQLKPSTFNYNSLTGYDQETLNRTVTGFIAQELQPVFPDMIGKTTINGTEYLDTNLSSLNIYLVKALQELNNKVDNNNSDLSLTSTGQINIAYNVSDEVLASLGYDGTKNEIESATYNLTDSLGNTVTRIAQFGQIAAAKIRAGLVSTTNLIADNAVINNLKTKNIETDSIISPVGNITHLTTNDIQSTSVTTDSLVAQNIQTTQITTDELTSDKITANEASISTLYADQIISKDGSFADIMANKISSLRNELTNIVSQNEQESTPSAIALESQNWSVNVATDSATISGNLNLTDNLVVGAQLMVSGDAQFGNAFVTGQFNVGNITIADNYIQTLDTAFYIQPNATGSVHILGDTLVIADTGDVRINGNLTVTGSVFASLLKASEIETQKLTAAEINSDKINIATSSGTIIADANDINIATGSAQINSNATAGTATLPSGKNELTISTNKLTANSMVYLTPVGSTNNQVLYVKEKTTDHFTVAIESSLDHDISVNWWIIN